MARTIFAILILLTLAATCAHALGVGGEGLRFGRLGASSKGVPAAAVATCNGTGLKFNIACNSQYIGTL